MILINGKYIKIMGVYHSFEKNVFFFKKTSLVKTVKPWIV